MDRIVTFSICVREQYEDDDGEQQFRFGVAVTTRLAAVGTLCPFASKHGAIATQSLVNVELGQKGIEYLGDGLAVDDALEALLNADEGSDQRQLHGVGSEGEFTFSGGECNDWFGHSSGENYTVAGNLLTGPEVIDATAACYERYREGEAPLAERLVEALSTGHDEGGDRRTDLPVQSAALIVETTEERELEPYYNDLRVDATETPIADMRTTLDQADRSFRMAVEKYEEAYEDDDIDAAGNDVG